MRLAASRLDPDDDVLVEAWARQTARKRPQGVAEIPRANLTRRSTMLRRALRLAGAFAVAVAIADLAPLPRGYWVPLTVAVLLQPAGGIGMGGKVIGRVLGTMLGILLAAGLDVAFMPHGFVVVALIAVLLWAAFSVLLANSALFTVFLSAMMVFLLSFVDVPPRVAMTGRLLDTVIGAALALVAYLL